MGAHANGAVLRLLSVIALVMSQGLTPKPPDTSTPYGWISAVQGLMER